MNQDFEDCYQSNLKLLEIHHPKIFEEITKNPPTAMGEISYAPNGNPNLTVTNANGNQILFHNELNPEKESLDYLEKIPEDHKGFVAILGMGLCYSALHIFKKRPHLQSFAIFELEPGIFLQALRHTDLSPILQDSRLILNIGPATRIPEILVKATRTLQLENATVLHHLPSFNSNLEGYNLLKDDLFSHLNSQNVGGTTTRKLGKDFLNNRFKHISTIHHHQLLERLHNKFDGIPAILVAGGPSLDKNIHLLKQAQEKAVIIAVDTVLPTLLKNGIHPHFLTCIDPNDLTFEKFADVVPEIKDIALITASWVNQKTAKVFPADQIFWTFTGKPMEAWLNSLLGGKLLTGGASTVAHLNLISAHILRCDPVIFIGQDLAYPTSSLASHAKGTVLQGLAPTEVTTTQDQGETVTGINGETLQTNRSFLSMKSFFESSIATSDRTHINATQGGADIKGTKILTLQEAIDKHCNSQINITKLLDEFYAAIEPIKPDSMLIEFKRMLNKIKQLQRTIKKSDDISNSLFKELKKYKKVGKLIKSFSLLPLRQQQQINKIHQFHQDIDRSIMVWKILEEITMEGLKESERQKQDISILEHAPDKYIEWLIQNLTRILDINKIRKKTLTILTDNLNMVISFHKKENSYIEKINKRSKKEQNMLKLARYYVSTKNYYLATPLLEELCKVIPQSAETYFYLGCCAAQSGMDKKTKQYFKTALEYDPTLHLQIDSYLQRLGDDFLNFANYFKTQPGRELSIKYMVLKGLKYDQTNEILKKELEIILTNDLQKIKSDTDTVNYSGSTNLINEWYQNAMDQKKLFDSLSADLVSNIFLNKAKLFLSQKDYSNALTNLKIAMGYSPKDHDIHSTIIETLFITGDFNNAIEALNIAIDVDIKFAAYWETIGDSLQADGQHEDALIAYEKCFINLPDNINLLKKMGDSYMATDQLEAAKTAYQQLKLRIEALK